MKRPFLSFCLILLLVQISIGQQKTIQLYDGPAPGTESWNWEEMENEKNVFQTKVVYNVTRPTLNVFMPDAAVANGAALIICPGGAFHTLSINSEGNEVANWLVKKGVTCFVLKYRLVRSFTDDPLGEWMAKLGKKEFEEQTSKVIPFAIADGKAAIEYVRKHAAEFNIDATRIGIMGFSAGGTLAAAAAFNYTPANRPDFVAPVYAYFPSAMYGTVAQDAPPMFIVAATDDQLNLAPHSVDLYNKWISSKVSSELHMFSKGGHGFGMRTQNLPSDKWISNFSDWMGTEGLFVKKVVNPASRFYEKKQFVFAGDKTLCILKTMTGRKSIH